MVAGRPALLQAGHCALHQASGIVVLLNQGKKLHLSKLHIVPPVAMPFWDAGGRLRTLIICVCSRTGAMKGDAAVWEP